MSSGPRAVPTYNSQPVPSNYVAGLGRGAIGFTTRSDIGPARDQVASSGGDEPPPAPAAPTAQELEKSEADYSETQYDEEYGYGGNLFGDTPYEEDDAEADRVYEAIDERMDERRKRRREEQLLENMKKYRQERPKISDQFADLKRELASVPQTDWESIPEVGDYSLKIKQKKKADTYTPVPDSVLHANLGKGQVSSLSNGMATPLGMGGAQTPMGGLATPFGGWSSSGNASSLAGITSESGGLAQARGTVLSLKLDKMSDSVTGQTVVDPKGYLTDLNSIKINSDAEVGDIKKARLLLRSVTTTNPKNGAGWIAAARVEEFAGKIVAARSVMKQACEICPDSEDVWLESARLQSTDNAKTILANAVHHLPSSVKIWLQAAELESDKEKKKMVLRRALEFVPNSVKLWRTAISLESAGDARLLLGRAVECVPHSVDMWLALARLETYEKARQVLNQARQAIPTEPAIWITAAKLEEAHGHVDRVSMIIEKAVNVLTQDQVVIDREQWLKEAEAAEHAGAPITCASIVQQSVWRNVEDDDRKRTWMDDAESCMKRECPETARAIYAHALSVFPTKKSIWKAACDLEKKYGTPASLEAMLKKSVEHCPQAEIMWLIYAKEKWMSGDVSAAREVLVDAFKANPDSEDIWLAAAKLEWESDEIERARTLLIKACDRAPSPKVFMKLANLERECGNITEELQLLDTAIAKYPTFDKYYMMAGQACEFIEDYPKARSYYQAGVRRCPASLPLWRLASALEVKAGGGVVKARSILELARLKNPKCDVLWLAAVQLEVDHKNDKMVTSLMAKALQECPNSGILLAKEIQLASQPTRRSKCHEAMKRVDEDPHVSAVTALIFANERKYSKARKWFERAVTINDTIGDIWAQYYSFELKHGTDETREAIKNRCAAINPRYGDVWCSISKAIGNRKLKPVDILERAASHFETP